MKKIILILSIKIQIHVWDGKSIGHSFRWSLVRTRWDLDLHYSSTWPPCRFWCHKQWYPSGLAERIGDRWNGDVLLYFFFSWVNSTWWWLGDEISALGPYYMEYHRVWCYFISNLTSTRTLGEFICSCGVRYHQYDDGTQLYISASGKLTNIVLSVLFSAWLSDADPCLFGGWLL